MEAESAAVYRKDLRGLRGNNLLTEIVRLPSPRKQKSSRRWRQGQEGETLCDKSEDKQRKKKTRRSSFYTCSRALSTSVLLARPVPIGTCMTVEQLCGTCWKFSYQADRHEVIQTESARGKRSASEAAWGVSRGRAVERVTV